MRTKEILFSLLLGTVFFLNACKKDDNPVHQGATTTPTVLMPLKIGNQWTYRSISLDSLGVVQHVDTSTFKIVRDTLIQNERWYSIGRDSTAREFLTNRTDGLWYMSLHSTGTIAQAPVLFAKYPANVNDSWLGPDSSTAKLVTNNLAVTVPQGTYTCFQYSYTDKRTGALWESRYFPPGIGFVKDEGYSKTSSGQTYVAGRRELMGLALNKPSSTQTTDHSRVPGFHSLFWFNSSNTNSP